MESMKAEVPIELIGKERIGNKGRSQDAQELNTSYQEDLKDIHADNVQLSA